MDEIVFQKNINNMKMYNNILAEKLMELIRKDNFKRNENITVELCDSRDGNRITKINVMGKSQYLNSTYAPFAEAEKVASQYKDIHDYGVMVVFGLSNGIIAQSIIDALPQHTNIVFYEPSLEIFLHVIYNYDLGKIMSDQRTCIFVKGINDEMLEPVLGNMINEANFKYAYYDALPRYRSLYPELCEEIRAEFEIVVQTEKNTIETIKWNGRIETENNIYNIPLLINCNCEEEFRSSFPNHLPVVIVAAGPSVKRNIDQLKLLKNRLLIMAVDTIAKYLVNNGVRPDIVVTVDPVIGKDTFSDMAKCDLIYACGTGVNHNIQEYLGNGRKIMITTRCPYYDNLMNIEGHHLYALNNGGSVATVAFALAQVWGYKKYILVGQDLALEGSKRYADETLNIDDDRSKFYTVEGYNGGYVETPADLKIYLDWYEMMARSHPDYEIINSTEGGARIAGTIQEPLSEVVREFDNNNYDYEKIITEKMPLFTGNSYNNLVKYVKGTIDNITDIKKRLGEGLKLIDCTEKELEGGVIRIDLRQINHKISEIMDYCAGAEESYFIDGIIADEHADDLGDIYEEDNDPLLEYKRILKKTKNYACDMYEATDEVKKMFEDVMTKM